MAWGNINDHRTDFVICWCGLTNEIQFLFPDQLQAFEESKTLMVISYSSFLAGNMLMWPAILTFVNQIKMKSPKLAVWGGTFAIFSLFARTFHAGIDHLAFQIADVQNVELATKIVADSYGAFHIVSGLNLMIMMGWTILAIAAFRSNVLNVFSAVALALMSGLPLGVLKGTTNFSIIATGGLCIAFIPLAIKIIKNGSMPSVKKAISWTVGISLLVAFLFFIGRMG